MNDIERAKSVVAVEGLVSNFRSTRMEILKSLSDGSIFQDGYLWSSVIPSDTGCLASSSQDSEVPSCCYCSSLRHLCGQQDGVEWKIEAGSLKNNSYVIEVSDLPQPIVRKDHIRQLASQMISTNEPLNYLGSDTLTLRLLLSILTSAVRNVEPSILGVYRCRSKVVTIWCHHIQISELGEVEDWMLSSIISSSLSLVLEMAPYQVVWQRPSISQIEVSSNWIRNENRSQRAELRLGDGSGSFATSDFRMVPLLTSSSDARLLNQIVWDNNFERHNWKNEEGNMIELYSLDGLSLPLYHRMRMAGLPLWSGSFELYCMIVGYYYWKRTRHLILELLESVWTRIWPGHNHLQILESRCQSLELSGYEGPCCHDITMALIEGLWLRSDLVGLLSQIGATNSS